MRMAPQTGIGGTVGAFYTRAAFFASSQRRWAREREYGHTGLETRPERNGLFVDCLDEGACQGGAT
jgi:hypothetical protein